MITKLYRKYIPTALRESIYSGFLGQTLFLKRNFDLILHSKLVYIFQPILPKTEKNELYAFIGKHGISDYPFPESLPYYSLKIECHFDKAYDMNFVIHNGKKLYFPISMTEKEIVTLYKSLLIEQDKNSPHRYVNSYSELQGKTLLDIGAAEGIFSLDVIDYINHTYLFECDEKWIKALKATFAPWKEKTTIVKKFVSDKNDDTQITIDEFMKDKPIDNLFIKMDIEGSEEAALKNAEFTIENSKDLRLAICTYHRENDAEIMSEILQKKRITYSFTNGHLLFNKKFRKALIRGEKQ